MLIGLDSGNRASLRRLFDHYPCLHLSSVAVSREHRRAKTYRLDTELLKRGFLGWLRGERGHCSMARCADDGRRGRQAAKPRAPRPSEGTHADCEPDKVDPGRLGIRNFKPTLRKAADRLATVHTPEGMPLPPNTLAELQRDMARLGFVVSQIREIDARCFAHNDEAIPEYETVLAFDRNSVSGVVALAHCKLMTGPIEEVIPRMEQAIRLDPRDTQPPFAHGKAHTD
jgi:hypothetical protein